MVFWLRKARVRTPSSPQTQAGEKPGLTCRWFHACELSDGFRGMRPKPGHLDSGPGLLWELLRKKSFLSPRRWSWSSEDVGLDLTGAGSQSAWEGRRRAERRGCGPLNPAASTRLSQTLGGRAPHGAGDLATRVPAIRAFYRWQTTQAPLSGTALLLYPQTPWGFTGVTAGSVLKCSHVGKRKPREQHWPAVGLEQKHACWLHLRVNVHGHGI